MKNRFRFLPGLDLGERRFLAGPQRPHRHCQRLAVERNQRRKREAIIFIQPRHAHLPFVLA